jgi:hypothetical protein
MDSKDIVGIILAVLVPVVTATLGAIGVALQDWRASRSRLGRRKTALEDARAQVGFVAEWWTVQQSLNRLPEALESATSQAKAMLDRASATVTASQLPRPQSPLTSRRLFLLYPFGSWVGRLVRASFYVACGVTVIILGTSVTQQLRPGLNQEGWVNAFLAIGGLTAALALGLRFLAVEVEENAASAASRGESNWGFIRRMLLLYRFGRASSRLVRLLFYTALVGVGCYVVYAVEITWYYLTFAYLPTFVPSAMVFGAAVVGVRSWAVSLELAEAGSGGDEVPNGPGAAAVNTSRREVGNGLSRREGGGDVAAVR